MRNLNHAECQLLSQPRQVRAEPAARAVSAAASKSEAPTLSRAAVDSESAIDRDSHARAAQASSLNAPGEWQQPPPPWPPPPPPPSETLWWRPARFVSVTK